MCNMSFLKTTEHIKIKNPIQTRKLTHTWTLYIYHIFLLLLKHIVVKRPSQRQVGDCILYFKQAWVCICNCNSQKKTHFEKMNAVKCGSIEISRKNFLFLCCIIPKWYALLSPHISFSCSTFLSVISEHFPL